MNRHFSMPRAWKLVILLLVLLIVAAFLVPIPVNLELDGVEVNMQDETHLVPRTITIEGALHVNLIRGHRFSGEIRISGYDPPEAAHMEGGSFSTIDGTCVVAGVRTREEAMERIEPVLYGCEAAVLY